MCIVNIELKAGLDKKYSLIIEESLMKVDQTTRTIMTKNQCENSCLFLLRQTQVPFFFSQYRDKILAN